MAAQVDRAWIEGTGSVYTRTSAVVRDLLGYDLFFSAGTLLGVVREDGRMLEHDNDVDSAYVSRYRTGKAASGELARLGEELNREGLNAHVSVPMRTHLHVHDLDQPELRIDVFHLYLQKGRLRLPSGVSTKFGWITNWDGVTDATWEGVRGKAPIQAEELLAHIYGKDWRTPKLGVDWTWIGRTRRRHLPGQLTEDQVELVESARLSREDLDCEK